MGAEFDLIPRFGKGGPTRTALQTLLQVVFWALVLCISYRVLSHHLPRYLPRDWASAHEFDALMDWKAAQLYFQGKSPYSPEGLAYLRVAGMGHPPTTPFLFLPLAGLEKALTAELIGLSVWLCLAIHAYLCALAVRFPSPIALALLVWSFMIGTGGFLMHFWAVQLSEHIAFLYVLCWWYLRRGQETRAGVALGLAATLKLFPGLMFLFLLLARRFRAFFAASLTFGFAAAVMTAVYGFKAWPLFFAQQKPIALEWMGHVRNASLQGIVVRLFSPACVAKSVPTSAATWTAIGISVLVLGLAGFLCFRGLTRAKKGDPRACDLPFALFALLSVFLNAWIWEHYTVLLIQPAFVMCAFVIVRYGKALRGYLDEHVSMGALLRNAALTVSVLAGVAFSAWLLTLNIYAKERMNELYRAGKEPFFHLYFHVYEAINYAPWVILIVLCFACVIAERAGRARLESAQH
jgi:hypothetical protein